MSILTVFLLIVIGFLAGLIGGLIGVGGGIIIIPLLILMLDMTQHQAQGTALFTMLPPIGILAAINYYKQGVVNLEYASIIAFTFLIGGYFGSKISLSISPEIVRRIFGVVMLIGAIKLIFTE